MFERFADRLWFCYRKAISMTMIPEIKEAMRASSKIQTEKEILLSVHDLHVWYELRRFGFGFAGHVKAVDGVSFELAQGETVAVVGESGCGKSSLMKTILGINIPTTGELIFEGKNLAELSGNDLRDYRFDIGYVQQDPYAALPPFMNVQQILEEPLIISGVKDQNERLERIHKTMSEV